MGSESEASNASQLGDTRGICRPSTASARRGAVAARRAAAAEDEHQLRQPLQFADATLTACSGLRPGAWRIVAMRRAAKPLSPARLMVVLCSPGVGEAAAMVV